MRSVVEMSAGVPAFLGKLWKLVEDPTTDNLISWSPGGKMFSIQNQSDFARELLPLYYKHNNMASFIRQLNMYGFHKVASVENGGLKAERDEIEFSHPCFMRDHSYLLEHIKRKIANPRQPTANHSGEEKAILKPELMTKVLTDVKHMKGKQESLDARFSVMKHENEALWREVALLRQKHIKQQQIVNNLIQFLMSLVQPPRNGPLKTGVKRPYQLMINDAGHYAKKLRGAKSPRKHIEPDSEQEETESTLGEEENGPIIHEVPEQDQRGTKNWSRINEGPVASTSPSNYKYASPSPDTSRFTAGADVYNIIAEDIRDPNTENISIDPRILTGESPVRIESMSPAESDYLIESSQTHCQNVVQNGNRKKNGKKTVSLDTSSAFSHSASTQPPTTLPTNIFDSDEANSQDESQISLSDVNQQAAISALQSAADTYLDTSSNAADVDYLNSVASGSYNLNINLNSASMSSKRKTKVKMEQSEIEKTVKNIKEEILNPEEDEPDWSNMTLATVPVVSDHSTRPTLNRFQSVTVKDISARLCPDRKSKILPGTSFPKEEVDDHLDTMQSDLESLRELLCGDSYSLDANTLLGLFGQEDPFYSLPLSQPEKPIDSKSKENTEDSESQLISYVPTSPPLDFEDFELDDDNAGWQPPAEKNTAEDNDDSLNTPQMTLSAPNFPHDSTD